ncbi:GNAT superfamily N-acetyltransferase [Microbacterium resistens]|uniref:GNAT superfamily N-acetyltransferase n=1 Tax=Microbacterium resistens TaxID=156977 RepID=A0ABU1S971_9MICO|nr:GNAT family N-acetyltransferase [Microbacterium resistens]MDR6866151.1 GNAT superfamily N-acetyltransferase [Microbacterium resistens]
MTALPSGISLRPAVPDDLEAVVALKAEVLSADLDRLVGWSPERSRERVIAHFSPGDTRMILEDGVVIGTVTLRPEDGELWLEMFYLTAARQGSGIGSAVLVALLAEVPASLTVRLQVLVGSAARGLYERHGFVAEEDDGVDVWMRRPPTGSSSVGTD